MGTSMGAEASDPITSLDQLVDHFHHGRKRADDLRVGMEHEKIAVLPDGSAPGYEVIAALLAELRDTGGWEPIEEPGGLVGLRGGRKGSVTLEPGGQIEHSGATWANAVEAVRDNEQHLAELKRLARARGVTLIGIGFRPFGTLDDVPWMPKGRYRVMRAYLPTRGARAHEMMKRTATVQANFDFRDEADAIAMMRTALGLSPLVTALFAASPIVDGKPAGYQSYRAATWLETDPDRCGLLPFLFDEGASFRSYVQWALDVPMFFVYRGGEYRPMHLPFRRFMADGWQGETATMADWELHLSTLFPEVRLKRYVEVRQADASTAEMVGALPALWRGLLYDAEAQKEAWALTSEWSIDERERLMEETPRLGLRATVRGWRLVELCKEMVEIARLALLRLGSPEGAALLQPLERIVAEERSVADRILDDWQATGGDPAQMIARLAL
jgi:glutamate--cysteine ligase